MIKIAKNAVYNEETVTLQDGTEITLRPSVIKVLRAGNRKMEAFADAETEDEALTIMTEAALICIAKQLPEGYTLEDAEDVLDMPTVYKILDVCLGIRINNPKLLEALEATQTQNQE